jgi:hypothetical protein
MSALLIVTVVSLVVAVVMSVVAWRLARDERRRSEARVETLAAEIYADEPPLLRAGDYHAPEATPRTERSLAAALAVGVLFVGSVIALALAFSGGSGELAVATPPAAAAPGATGASRPPLELTRMSHERDGSRLLVRGAVRDRGTDEVTGAPLFAVVSVFDKSGRLLASPRTAIDGAALASGIESDFALAINGVDEVYRYRVSFRTDDGVVAHVDRRSPSTTVQLP